jgi:hypothetical protein
VLNQVGERPENFVLKFVIAHGCISPIVGRWPTGCERVLITSTRTVVPGKRRATREARVIPS